MFVCMCTLDRLAVSGFSGCLAILTECGFCDWIDWLAGDLRLIRFDRYCAVHRFERFGRSRLPRRDLFVAVLVSSRTSPPLVSLHASTLPMHE